MNLRGVWNWYHSENSAWPPGVQTVYLAAGPGGKVWAVTIGIESARVGANPLYHFMLFQDGQWEQVDRHQFGLTHPFTNVGCFHCDPAGRLWLHLQTHNRKGEAIGCFDGQSSIIFRADEKGLPSEILAMDFASDAEGNCWMAMASLGVYYCKDERWQRFSLIDDCSDGWVSSITADHKGRLWFVARRPKTTLFLCYDGKQCYVYAEAPVGCDLGLKAFDVDRAGNVWAGCFYPGKKRGAGLWMLEVETKQWHRYSRRNSALPDYELYNIAFDKAGRTWIASGEGLTIFEGEQSANWWVSMPGVAHRPIGVDAMSPDWDKAEKQLMNLMSPIIADTQGRIWAASYEGVGVFLEA
jgi:ligand-binding sensor domain-containing protein